MTLPITKHNYFVGSVDELADTTRRIDDFLNFMRDYTILEICRTGCVSLHKGLSLIHI